MAGCTYLQTWLPIVDRFRVPARYVLFAQLALAAVAAIGLERLLHADADRRLHTRALWAPWGIAAVSVVLADGVAWNAGGKLTASPQWRRAVLLGPALFVAAAGLMTIAVRNSRRAVIALVLLAAGDQALPPSLPRVRLVTDVRTSREPAADLDRLDVHSSDPSCGRPCDQPGGLTLAVLCLVAPGMRSRARPAPGALT